MSISRSSSLPVLLTPSSSSTTSLPSPPLNTRPNSHPKSNRSRTSSWLGQSLVAISDTVAGADFAHHQGADSRSRLTSLSSTTTTTTTTKATKVPSIYSLQASEPLVPSSASMTSRMFARPSGQRSGAKAGEIPRVDVVPSTPKSIASIVELPNLHEVYDSSLSVSCSSSPSSPSSPSPSSLSSSGEHSAVSSSCSSPSSSPNTNTHTHAKKTAKKDTSSNNIGSNEPCVLPHSPCHHHHPYCPQHPRPRPLPSQSQSPSPSPSQSRPHSRHLSCAVCPSTRSPVSSSSCSCSCSCTCACSCPSSPSCPPPPSSSSTLPIGISRSRSITFLSHSHSHSDPSVTVAEHNNHNNTSSRTLHPILRSEPSLSSCHTYALNTSPVECQSLSGPLSASPSLLRQRGSLFSALSISLNPFGATSTSTHTNNAQSKSTPATPLYRSPDYLTAFFADTPPSSSPLASSTLGRRTPRSRTSSNSHSHSNTGTTPFKNNRRTATWHVDLSSVHTDLGIDIPIDKATPFSGAPSSFSGTLPASSAVSHQRSRTTSPASPLPSSRESTLQATEKEKNPSQQETRQILSSVLSSSPSSSLSASPPPSYSSLSPTPRHNSHPHTSHHRILINHNARSPIDSRIHHHHRHHHHHHHPHIHHNSSTSRRIASSAPTSANINIDSATTQYRSRNSSSSLYKPIMLPKKAKQAVLSLVTTEPSKHGGPPKSTTSTVSADWDNDSASSSIPNTSAQSTEPNSGSADWMVVSGATYHSNPVPVPTNASTPLTVREEQLNRLPALQLLERSEDTDPVLDVDVAHQIRLELPRKLRNATKWNLVYSSDQHGISMTTLYHRCRGKGPMILAVKDSYDCVFGAFINEELKPHLSYYGTGECFLWNVTTLSSPKVPASPTFGPSPLPSPSPLQLSSTMTTPGTGRSPSPSLSPPLGTNASRAAQIGENRRQDLLQAMSDRLSVGARSPSPSPLSPFTTHNQHATSSPSYSPTLRPVTSSNVSTPTAAGATISTTPPSSTGASVPVVPIPRRKKKQKVVQFWRWSGKNDYMVLSEPGFIGLGGGDGKFGLWIHSDLERGHSARCATFENEPLAAACRHPIRGTSVNGHIELAPAKTPVKTTGHEGRGNGGGPERSASPSENEEFYCQTVEIWSLAL